MGVAYESLCGACFWSWVYHGFLCLLESLEVCVAFHKMIFSVHCRFFSGGLDDGKVWATLRSLSTLLFHWFMIQCPNTYHAPTPFLPSIVSA